MRIGLSMRVVQAGTYDEPRDAISQDWVRWLADLGHIALPIPNACAQAGAYLDEMNVEALILTGGNDVGPRPGVADDTADERTATEHALIDGATQRSIAILGTCRGLHVLNLHFGGGVIDDLNVRRGAGPGHVACNHGVTLDACFGGLAGSREIQTNSFHNQAVSDNELAGCLRAFAHSADGLIEGLFHRTLPIVAIQWHPERPNPAAGFDATILEKLLSGGAFWREEEA